MPLDSVPLLKGQRESAYNDVSSTKRLSFLTSEIGGDTRMRLPEKDTVTSRRETWP